MCLCSVMTPIQELFTCGIMPMFRDLGFWNISNFSGCSTCTVKPLEGNSKRHFGQRLPRCSIKSPMPKKKKKLLKVENYKLNQS